MKFRVIILFVFSCMVLPVFAQKDSTYRLYSCKHREDKLQIKRVRIANSIVIKKKTIPKDFRELKNLEYLSLRPSANRYMMPKGGGSCIVGYFESSICYLPDWIVEFQYLTELDLIGITKLDYNKELKKISMLPNLEYLSIDPDEVTQEQLAILCTINQVEVVKDKMSYGVKRR